MFWSATHCNASENYFCDLTATRDFFMPIHHGDADISPQLQSIYTEKGQKLGQSGIGREKEINLTATCPFLKWLRAH